jgi:hypothetical protein
VLSILLDPNDLFQEKHLSFNFLKFTILLFYKNEKNEKVKKSEKSEIKNKSAQFIGGYLCNIFNLKLSYLC